MTTLELFPELDWPEMESLTSWPTPTASDAWASELDRNGIVGKHNLGLGSAVRLMSSAAASHARTSRLQAKAQASKVNAQDYGASMPVLLANYDPLTRSWKTCQRSLEGGWTEFSETWPRSGTMRSGIAYQLQPLVRLIGGTESGLWPPPSATDYKGSVTSEVLEKRKSMTRGVRLPEQVMREQFPTPTTPRPHDSENTAGKFIPSQKQYDLTSAVAQNGGQLNPTWVEWLMGFPLEWSALKPSEMP